MSDQRTISILKTILETVEEGFKTNERLHAHTDVVLVEAIRSHNEDPDAHGGRITRLEKMVADLAERVGEREGE